MDERACKKNLTKPKEIATKNKTGNEIPPLRIMRKRLTMKPYKLQLVQAITTEDKRKRKQYCVDMQEKFYVDEFMKRLVFNDEATFHANSKVYRHNVYISGKENPHATVEHVRDSPKVSVLFANSKKQVYRPFFVQGNVTGDVYLHTFQNWLMDDLTANEHYGFISQ